jgi:hypothetical protein
MSAQSHDLAPPEQEQTEQVRGLISAMILRIQMLGCPGESADSLAEELRRLSTELEQQTGAGR